MQCDGVPTTPPGRVPHDDCALLLAVLCACGGGHPEARLLGTLPPRDFSGTWAVKGTWAVEAGGTDTCPVGTTGTDTYQLTIVQSDTSTLVYVSLGTFTATVTANADAPPDLHPTPVTDLPVGHASHARRSDSSADPLARLCAGEGPPTMTR